LGDKLLKHIFILFIGESVIFYKVYFGFFGKKMNRVQE
jgi:hypothetical protein